MARRVGIVGIGIMGTAMMRNLVADGFEVFPSDEPESARYPSVDRWPGDRVHQG